MHSERMGNWRETYYKEAAEQIGDEALNLLWKTTYAWQITFTELALQNLYLNRDANPAKIPNINEIQNFKPITSKESVSLINVIGMPGAGKDTIIDRLANIEYPNLICAPEEGYFWSKKVDPSIKKLRQRHFRAYGGIEMEIDEMVDKLSHSGGIGLMNRSIEDNFLAFAYSFFLDGFMGVQDLIMSQKFYHFFQYSPSIKVQNSMTSVDDITAATFVLMVDPTTSLDRKGRSGRILNNHFLSLLYSQYLKMISRLRDDNHRNLVVLDMSGSLEESFALFQEKLDLVAG